MAPKPILVSQVEWRKNELLKRGTTQYRPHGRTQVGTRHLNFRKARDNLWLFLATGTDRPLGSWLERPPGHRKVP